MVRLPRVLGVSLGPADRGVAAALVHGAPPADVSDRVVVDHAIAQGAGPLLAASRFGATLTGELAAALADDDRLNRLHAGVLNAELRRVAGILSARGIDAIVLKGAHLAYTIYPVPHTRPRNDTDVLVRARDAAAFDAVLRECGYVAAPHARSVTVFGQAHYERTDPLGVPLYIDAHFRIVAPFLLEHAVDIDRVFACAIQIEALGVRGPALPDALAIGCLHLAAHHWPPANVLWLYDLRLLAGALDPDARRAFTEMASRGRFCRVASAALSASGALFPHERLDTLVRELDRAAGDEPSAALLGIAGSRLQSAISDWHATGWRRRLLLVKEHAFPDAAYMRAAFGDGLLPVMYARRAWRGVRRWISPRD